MIIILDLYFIIEYTHKSFVLFFFNSLKALSISIKYKLLYIFIPR